MTAEWLSTFVVFSIILNVRAERIYISSNTSSSDTSLGFFLCHPTTTLPTGTTLVLSSNGTHTVAPGLFCLIENATDLTITSSDSNIPAHIKCDGNETGGFGFFNITNLSISNIIVDNCGGVIPEQAVRFFNNTDVIFYAPGQKAALLIHHCNNVEVSNIKIENYQGYGIVGANILGQSHFDGVTIHKSQYFQYQDCTTILNGLSDICPDFSCSGSGAFFYYQEIQGLPEIPSSLVISHSQFTEGINCPRDPDVIFANTRNSRKNIPVTGAGGLTLGFFEINFNVSVLVESSTISNNMGFFAGGTMIVFLDTTTSASLVFDNCTFEYNTLDTYGMYGAGLAQYILFSDIFRETEAHKQSQNAYPLIVKGSIFRHHNPAVHARRASYGGALYIVFFSQTQTEFHVTIEDTDFYNNSALIAGDCMYAYGALSTIKPRALNVVLRDIRADYNGDSNLQVNEESGLFSFTRLGDVQIHGTVEGSSIFQDNYGSVISVGATRLHLSGSLLFTDNVASRGAGISLQSQSFLFLEEPLNGTFVKNTAIFPDSVGGAIYAEGITDQYCIIQAVTQRDYFTLESLSEIEINLTFINNSATLGSNSILATPLYECFPLYDSRLQVIGSNLQFLPLLYESIFHFQKLPLNNQSEITSRALRVCFCGRVATNLECLNYNESRKPYPGQAITVHMVPKDANSNSVYSAVIATLYPSSWHLAEGEDLQQLHGNMCTPVNYTVFSTGQDSKGTIVITTLSRLYDIVDPAVINIQIRKCPLGFGLDNGRCECSPLFSARGLSLTCNINTELVSRPANAWIGPHHHESETVLGYASTCPAVYCDAETTEINASDPFSLCNGGRTGVLCGQCIEGQSVIFGSNECRQCTNFWLFTIPLYALAGITLVFLLFALHLTISKGTINGVIFYANVIAIYSDGYFESLIWRGFLVIIAFINLDLGFPLCFYDGMDSAVKTGLQFVFPVYLWLIVALIILFSHFSTRVSTNSSVQVLATLTYLSYSKILITVIEVVTATTVYTDQDNHYHSVWYYDGSVDFFTGKHVILVLVSLIATIFLAIYTILLTIAGPRFCLKYRKINRLLPLLDAYHGPYKCHLRYWFGARLWLLVVLFGISSGLSNRNLSLTLCLQVLLLTGFTVVQSYFQPFRNTAVGVLDLFFMLNLVATIIFGVYAAESYKDVRSGSSIVINVLLGFACLVFSFILIYHFVKRIKPILSKKLKEWKKQTEVVTPEEEPPRPTVRHMSVTLYALRESLLETNDTTLETVH